nr:protein nemuri-like [Bactrocera oleae]
MSSKIIYFLAALLAIFCLLQQIERTAAANTQQIRRAFAHERLAARKQLQQNTRNQLNTNQYNNQDNEDDFDENDDRVAEDDGDANSEDDFANSTLRNENAKNAAQAQEQNEVEATVRQLTNSVEGVDNGGRARRRRRRGRGRRRGRRGGRRRRRRRGGRRRRRG